MYPLFETIKIQQNKLPLTAFHNERVNRTRYLLYGSTTEWEIDKLIDIPKLDINTVYRCRFMYGQHNYRTEFIPYQPRQITKLYLVYNNQIDYSCKYTDRQKLEDLRISVNGIKDADVLIVKKGLITDTSYANIVFYDGTMWYTPKEPLLQGTKRAYYLSAGTIAEKTIRPADLKNFLSARLINAMIDLETGVDIPIHNIFI